MNKKYQIDSIENIHFLNEIRKNLVDFGKHVVAPDGTAYYLGDDGSPWPNFNRDTYENARMYHVYGMAALLYGQEWNRLTDGLKKGLTVTLRDRRNGGWFDGLLPDEQPKEGKQCYSHAFVVLAAADALMAKDTGAEEFFNDAVQCFDQYFWIEKDGMTADTWNTELSTLDDYRGLNANMHTVEALLNAADASAQEVYRERAGRIINRVIKLASDNEWRIPEHYTEKWQPLLDYNKDHPDDQFKPYGATPGHGLEWARLILQWASSTFGPDHSDFPYYCNAAENLFDRAVKDGWHADGSPGFVYTTDWFGKPIVSDRMHWVLAEAINTAAVLYRVTKKETYASAYAMFMQYLDTCVLDHKLGSWFHQLNQKNEPIDSVWPGKPDLYHAFQATLIPYCPIHLSVFKAVKEQLYADGIALAH